MFLSRHRWRAPAVFLSGFLLLIGAGEVLGVCYCAHRGGHPMEAHGAGHVSTPDAEAPHASSHGTEDGHPEGGHPADADMASLHHAEAQPEGEHATDEPAGTLCRALCAVACTVNASPPSAATHRTPDLDSCSALAQAPAVEPADLVPVTTRPYVLPPSQAPPIQA